MLIHRSFGIPRLAMHEALQPFARLVLADAAIQARLGGILEPDRFADCAVEVAQSHLTALDRDLLGATVRSDPLGFGLSRSAPVTLDCWPGGAWLPTRSAMGCTDEPELDWAWFGDAPIRSSFYEDAVRQARVRPFNRVFRSRTNLDALIAGADSADFLPPTGLIFHMSRCGSTLLANMLAAPDHHAVVSEPEPFDTVLQWAHRSAAPEERKIAALRAVAAALGRRRSPRMQRFFIKCDAWHTLSLPLIRKAFPDVPWLFLYRDPIEVLVSHQIMAGMHTVPGMLSESLTGISETAHMSRMSYCAAIIAQINSAVLKHWHLGGGMTVNYRNIIAGVAGPIPEHFGFTPDPAEISGFRAASERDSKQQDQTFSDDSAAKRAAASPEIVAQADGALKKLHQQLEQLNLR